MPYSREERCKAYRDRQLLTLTRVAMDEIQFARAYANLRILIDCVQAGDENVQVHVRNALLTVAALLDGLNQRITEMQVDEEEDE